jgi:hypothetical protein
MQGQGPQVVAVRRENVERVKLRFVVVLARVHSVEIEDAVDANDYRFAVDDEIFCQFFNAASAMQG